MTPLSRNAWLASGWDEKSLLASAFKSRIEALRGADANASNAALLEFQTSPESLPALKEALASEKDDFCKSRLESLCRWLDPAFGRKELSALGDARWFTKRKNRERAGWERIGAKVGADGRWTFSAGSSDGAVPGGPGSLEGTFTSPDFGLTSSFDAEVDMNARGSRVVISAEFRGAGATLKKVSVGGEEIPVDAESRPLKGTPRGPIIPSVLVPLFLERASLARLDCVQLSPWDLMKLGSRLTGTTFVFAGEDRVSVAGKEVAARKYEVAGNGDAGTYWITDEAGVVKFRLEGLESVLTSEADAKKAADDPK